MVMKLAAGCAPLPTEHAGDHKDQGYLNLELIGLDYTIAWTAFRVHCENLAKGRRKKKKNVSETEKKRCKIAKIK